MGVWIPAFAGMTVGWAILAQATTGVLDSGRRRNDGGGDAGWRAHTVIPAKAGIHTPIYADDIPAETANPVAPSATGVLDSGLRRNDGGVAYGNAGVWIPAFAGMTVGGRE